MLKLAAKGWGKSASHCSKKGPVLSPPKKFLGRLLVFISATLPIFSFFSCLLLSVPSPFLSSPALHLTFLQSGAGRAVQV